MSSGCACSIKGSRSVTVHAGGFRLPRTSDCQMFLGTPHPSKPAVLPWCHTHLQPASPAPPNSSKTDRPPTWHHRPALQHTLDHTQCVVQRPVHLVQVHVVGATQQQRRCCTGLGAVDLDLWAAAQQGNTAAELFEVLRPVGCSGQVTNKHIS